MRDRADVARGWRRKAASDLVAMEASIQTGAFDAACFHAQQAAERFLKAFLADSGVAFPFTHNLAKLVESCAGADPAFRDLLPSADLLPPFAVEVQYDGQF